ncbi:hypothetical protein FNV43_RR16142 [Rhamnella rubrinervis]|uniref:DUF6821 domain-containing protein n=1 Tax=Rhamnella rubrinervis TaxID=2594499 RepID=A0A8K0GXL6_9ROSA|nr:hypothetical protein FNV43_RR16142 [Rhamnella rubrinervis]
MDLDEWEYLPDDGFLDYHADGEKKIFPSKRNNSETKSVFNMNYFICPSPNSMRTDPTGNSRVGSTNQLVPIQFEQPALGKSPEGGDHHHHQQLVKEITKVPIEISDVKSTVSGKVLAPNDCAGGNLEADQDTISQVFFKKMKENEFVDMKMDSPKSPTRSGGGFVPQIDSGAFQFDEKDDHQGMETKSSPRMRNNLEAADANKEVNWDGDDSEGGLNLWKLSFTGIGAICSFGIAAATICILFFGNQQKNQQHQLNQKLRFQIYTDDKRIKQAVHHATKLNEAISAARGIPLNRAHITYGGYYDGL